MPCIAEPAHDAEPLPFLASATALLASFQPTPGNTRMAIALGIDADGLFAMHVERPNAYLLVHAARQLLAQASDMLDFEHIDSEEVELLEQVEEALAALPEARFEAAEEPA